MNARFLLVLAVLLFSLASVQAVVPEHSTKIFAVTEDGKGLAASLDLRISAGSGKIFSGVDALVGTSTQNAYKVALDLAKNYFPGTNQYDYYFSIESTASIVDGPSAGAATSLLLISMLEDKTLPEIVAMTGTISDDGSVGTVGGVFEKSKAASEAGVKLFLIPKGEAKQVARTSKGIESVNLVEYAPRIWGMKVVEVGSIDEALRLAFSNIEAIDVNQQIEQSEQLFIPEPIPFHSQLEPLHRISADYLGKARDRLAKAKNALNSTILSDSDLVNVMFESLTESETVLEDAQNLYDQNFLYSSANYAFTAMVNAMLVEDIATNPSVLNDNSTLFQTKLQQLQVQLNSLKERLDTRILVEQADWQIASQQRWLWAQTNVEKLLGTQTIVIQTGEDSGVSVAQLDRLRDYEFAVAWKDVAEAFSLELQKETKKIENIAPFQAIADEQLVQAENKVPLLVADDRLDIERRYNGAKKAHSMQWYLPATADAASVSLLIDAEQEIQSKGLPELEQLLNQKIAELDQKLGNEKPFVWSRIYLDHARYFQQEIQYYQEQSLTSQALEAAQSGVSVVFLAESAYLSHEAIYRQINQSSTSPYTAPPVSPLSTNQPLILDPLLIATLVIIVLLVAVVVVLVVKLEKRPRTEAVELPFREIKEQGREFLRRNNALDREFVKGNLSQGDYEQKKRALLEQFSQKHAEQVQTPEGQVADLGIRYRELEKDLRELRKSFNRGEVSKPEFVEKFESLQGRLKKNQFQLEEEQQKLGELSKKNKTGLALTRKTSTALDGLASEIKKPGKPAKKTGKK